MSTATTTSAKSISTTPLSTETSSPLSDINLPDQVLQKVLSYLDTSTLFPSLRVNRPLNRLASSVLYSDLTVDLSTGLNPLSSSSPNLLHTKHLTIKRHSTSCLSTHPHPHAQLARLETLTLILNDQDSTYLGPIFCQYRSECNLLRHLDPRTLILRIDLPVLPTSIYPYSLPVNLRACNGKRRLVLATRSTDYWSFALLNDPLFMDLCQSLDRLDIVLLSDPGQRLFPAKKETERGEEQADWKIPGELVGNPARFATECQVPDVRCVNFGCLVLSDGEERGVKETQHEVSKRVKHVGKGETKMNFAGMDEYLSEGAQGLTAVEREAWSSVKI
ncbi:hypothetical protein BCR39DRAFT_558354 [Naematelia encephala]|uniref:F-box domain-containing protein n=1 Tax=Naematelia encephala TaxID=71784 RepID=A0A1Y2B8B2_9TREE|nr:hypothetical protein BCR39DRAFT_558354 [Naematelia encephala]